MELGTSMFNSTLIGARLTILLAQLESGETDNARLSIDDLIVDLDRASEEIPNSPGNITALTMKQVKRSLAHAGPDAAASGLRKSLMMVARDQKPAVPKDGAET